MSSQTRPKVNQAFKGALVGAISGPVILGSVVLVYGVVSAFATGVPGAQVLPGMGLAFVSVLVFGLSAAILGASIGAFNGVTDGGLGAGVEWLILVGIASSLGAWRIDQIDQTFDGQYMMFSIPMMAVGGIVGFLTWRLFRAKGTKRRLARAFIIGYLVTFLLGLTVGPCIAAYMLFFFFVE